MYRFLILALLAAASVPVSAAVQAEPAPQIPTANEAAFDMRARQLVGLMNGKIAYSDYFAPQFQQAVSERQFRGIAANLLAQYGAAVEVETVDTADGRTGTVKLRFEKGTGTIALSVLPGGDRRVDGLFLRGFTVANDSFDSVAAELSALSGRTGFLVAELDGEAIRPVASANADAAFAVGSTFKLYILDELASQVRAGKRKWSDVVPLAQLSFSSAATANWPKDTPVTLQTLANWMISVSDNGATDTLLHLLGRDAIEARMRATGHSDPSRNIPFLSTVEAFALKGNNFADLRAKFLAGGDEAQRRLLDANADQLVLSNIDGVSFGGTPRFIESLEWFATPTDLARAFADIKAQGSPEAMAAMTINKGVPPAAAADWAYLGYKGGSELGVLSMSLLGQRKVDGKWFVVTASWNNPDADVAAETLSGMTTRLLALAAK
ncbi:serine hydrolase [Sphingopyxis flava]|uniref:Beta-lactamase enzyme family protein n=1 Tax=Sphingopyxis flava TaxID=1507287 RepID=A0A1T5AGI2_9SPHN|nr:serine hydrolase [Sphingopyxis flava]SKB34025.1 Beta-lactamase enzyme family protein [Sphingopyxis flava]